MANTTKIFTTFILIIVAVTTLSIGINFVLTNANPSSTNLLQEVIGTEPEFAGSGGSSSSEGSLIRFSDQTSNYRLLSVQRSNQATSLVGLKVRDCNTTIVTSFDDAENVDTNGMLMDSTHLYVIAYAYGSPPCSGCRSSTGSLPQSVTNIELVQQATANDGTGCEDIGGGGTLYNLISITTEKIVEGNIADESSNSLFNLLVGITVIAVFVVIIIYMGKMISGEQS